MYDQEKIKELIANTENTNGDNSSQGYDSGNMNQLSQWADESINVLDNFLSVRDDSKEVYSNIKETKILVEELQNILNKNDSEEAIEKGEIASNYSFKDFYN